MFQKTPPAATLNSIGAQASDGDLTKLATLNAAASDDGKVISVNSSGNYALTIPSGAPEPIISDTDPTVNDDSGDGYEPGQLWIQPTYRKTYVCYSNTLGAAVWVLLTSFILSLPTVIESPIWIESYSDVLVGNVSLNEIVAVESPSWSA